MGAGGGALASRADRARASAIRRSGDVPQEADAVGANENPEANRVGQIVEVGALVIGSFGVMKGDNQGAG